MHTHMMDSLKKQASHGSVHTDMVMEFWKAQDTSNACATVRLEASSLISYSGTVVHIGKSIPVCQVLYTISSLQSSRQPHRWAMVTIAVLQMREPMYGIIRGSMTSCIPTWQSQQTRAILINAMFVAYVTFFYMLYMREPILILWVSISVRRIPPRFPTLPEATKEQPIESLSSGSQIQTQVIQT